MVSVGCQARDRVWGERAARRGGLAFLAPGGVDQQQAMKERRFQEPRFAAQVERNLLFDGGRLFILSRFCQRSRSATSGMRGTLSSTSPMAFPITSSRSTSSQKDVVAVADCGERSVLHLGETRHREPAQSCERDRKARGVDDLRRGRGKAFVLQQQHGDARLPARRDGLHVAFARPSLRPEMAVPPRRDDFGAITRTQQQAANSSKAPSWPASSGAPGLSAVRGRPWPAPPHEERAHARRRRSRPPRRRRTSRHRGWPAAYALRASVRATHGATAGAFGFQRRASTASRFRRGKHVAAVRLLLESAFHHVSPSLSPPAEASAPSGSSITAGRTPVRASGAAPLSWAPGARRPEVDQLDRPLSCQRPSDRLPLGGIFCKGNERGVRGIVDDVDEDRDRRAHAGRAGEMDRLLGVGRPFYQNHGRIERVERIEHARGRARP